MNSKVTQNRRQPNSKPLEKAHHINHKREELTWEFPRKFNCVLAEAIDCFGGN